jgi:hypothetical protein
MGEELRCGRKLRLCILEISFLPISQNMKSSKYDQNKANEIIKF